MNPTQRGLIGYLQAVQEGDEEAEANWQDEQRYLENEADYYKDEDD